MKLHSPQARALLPIYGLLVLAVFLNVALWLSTHRMQPLWPNVPPAPSAGSAATLGLGDRQLAYRLMAYQLQVIGNESGRSTPLYQYDYNRLGRWFHVLDYLDSTSNYVPYLASYYFGSTQRPEQQLRPVIDYLAHVGRMDHPGKWRFMAQAVYLAQHRFKNVPLALDLARELSKLPQKMPHWAYQMPAIVSGAAGDKDTAVELMRAILVATVKDAKAAGEKPDPVELHFMIDFICNRMQTPVQAARDPVCKGK